MIFRTWLDRGSEFCLIQSYLKFYIMLKFVSNRNSGVLKEVGPWVIEKIANLFRDLDVYFSYSQC